MRRAGVILLLAACALLAGGLLDREGPRKIKFTMNGVFAAVVGGLAIYGAVIERGDYERACKVRTNKQRRNGDPR